MNDLYQIDQEADSIPFDPTGSTLTTDTVGDALRELESRIRKSLTQSMYWSRTGPTPKGSYLQAHGIPSNNSSMISSLNGFAVEVTASVKNVGDYTFSIEKRSGVVYTEVLQFSMTAVRTYEATISVAVSKQDELVAKVRSNSTDMPSDAVVGLVLKGDYL